MKQIGADMIWRMLLIIDSILSISKVYLNHEPQQGSYQLNRINQHCEVWVGLILLDDGGTQRFTSTLYKHLDNKGQVHLSGCSFFQR